MIVGFMDKYANPPKIAKVTALMCTHFGIQLIYFRPSDIDLVTKTVNAKVYEENKWITAKMNLPPVIDPIARCFVKETREIMTYLRENTILTFDSKNTPNKNKLKLQKILLKDNDFSNLIIPTIKLDSFDRLIHFLNEYLFIIIKPLYGSRGRGLHSLRKQNETYILGYREEEIKLSYDELLKYYRENLLSEKYILQKFVESKTKNGDPFDCRVHVQKNRQGKWKLAKMFVRIGLGQKVMSNVHQGGGISNIKPFLKANFEDGWQRIHNDLKQLAVTLPYKIDDIKKTPTMELGFDVGIDESGKLFLFEANDGATVKPILAESAMLRVEYYQYIREKNPALMEHSKEFNKDYLLKKIKQLQKENEVLSQENNFSKKELKKIENSTSWRITGPLRRIRSYFTKEKRF